MSRFELENGRIRRYGEIFEGALALGQLGFAAERIAKVLRKWSDQIRALPQAAIHLKA
jgi:hypothetical protein